MVGGSYVITRLGLSDLEAGYAVSQLHGHVGDRMRVTYMLRNTKEAPILFVLVNGLSHRIKTAARQVKQKDGELASVAHESLSTARVVKTLAREDVEERRFDFARRAGLVV